MYLIFTKMTFTSTIISLIVLAILYIIYLYIEYYKSQKEDENDNKNDEIIENLELGYTITLIFLTIFVLLSFFYYAYRKKLERGKNFNILTFLFGVVTCANDGDTPKSLV